MSIHNADDANVSDIIFNNITIEDAQMNGDNQRKTTTISHRTEYSV